MKAKIRKAAAIRRAAAALAMIPATLVLTSGCEQQASNAPRATAPAQMLQQAHEAADAASRDLQRDARRGDAIRDRLQRLQH